jgi:subfamily B ATP-binding cassette protein MsbA
MRSSIRRQLAFFKQCLNYLVSEKILSIVFVVISILGALTEGISVSLLVPILDSEKGFSSFSDTPYIGHLAEYLTADSSSGTIQNVAIALIAILLLRGILQFLVQVFAVILRMRIRTKLTHEAYNVTMGMETSFSDQFDAGTLQNNIAFLPHRIALLLSDFLNIIWNFVLVFVYFVFMLTISVELTLYVILFMGLVSFGLQLFSVGPLYRAGEDNSNWQAKLNHVIYETFQGFKLVRLSVAEKVMHRDFTNAMDPLIHSAKRINIYTSFPSPAMATVAGIFICGLLYFLAAENQGEASSWVGSFLMFLFLMFRILNPITMINSARTRIAGNVHAFETFQDFMSQAGMRQQKNGHIPFVELENSVNFDKVNFSYNVKSRSIIRNLNLEIKKNEMVAIVGPSGSGKSTIISLLTRLYEPTDGGIYIDGTNLSDLDVASWRRRISVVNQDTVIFNDTIANNISFGRPGLSRQEIINAAKTACAHDFIMEMENAYDTEAGDSGVLLSGGQKQRLAIARAILNQPDILILDEATSQLDSTTENAVKNSMDEFSKKCTMIVIAHRLSTIVQADKIVVLKDGCIVEQGKHFDLVRAQGVYKELLDHQKLELVED